MLKRDLAVRNPLRLINDTREGFLASGNFGAVLSRSGGGKTALTVQIAMNALLLDKNVLHLSLTDPIEKVCLWYEELLSRMAGQYNEVQINQLWDILLPHRMIMTFRTQDFTIATLEERLNDLSEQKIFSPEVLVVDGFKFDESCGPILSQLKNLAEQRRFHIWFTVTTHRHEALADNGYPIQLSGLADLFDTVLQLKSGDGPIKIHVLKHPQGAIPKSNLALDPSTLLIQNLGD